jgi:hypothetical protein
MKEGGMRYMVATCLRIPRNGATRKKKYRTEENRKACRFLSGNFYVFYSVDEIQILFICTAYHLKSSKVVYILIVRNLEFLFYLYMEHKSECSG